MGFKSLGGMVFVFMDFALKLGVGLPVTGLLLPSLGRLGDRERYSSVLLTEYSSVKFLSRNPPVALSNFLKFFKLIVFGLFVPLIGLGAPL
jgi:hypothetical protein